MIEHVTFHSKKTNTFATTFSPRMGTRQRREIIRSRKSHVCSMAGAEVTFVDNNALTNYLVSDKLIKSPEIDQAFRVVDRGSYFLPEHKEKAYNLSPWKSGDIHLSSPNIYGIVMEHLKLSPNLTFLNIGSGTGYLSTMVGVILGPLGINHGVEIYQHVVDYANQKLMESKTKVLSLNSSAFCEPYFVTGNGLNLSQETSQYDRVYCGATCPENYFSYMKNLIKVGGVLVLPLKDELLQVTRTSEIQWEQKRISRVSFATLITPGGFPLLIKLPDVVKSGLQPISATSVAQNTTGQKLLQINNCVKNSQDNSDMFIPPSPLSSEEDEEDFEIKLLDGLKEVTEDLEELLECPVCFGPMDSTLVQCRSGHGTCSTCAGRIDKCPTCKQEFVIFQSTLLGKILEKLPKLCPYVDEGCSIVVLDKDHKTFCKFRPSSCKSTLCDWSGCVKDLIKHVNKCKRSKVCDISLNSMVSRFLPSDTTQNVFYSPILFQKQLFWECVQVDVTKKSIAYKFYHVATVKPAHYYYFKVSFKKGKIEYVNSFKAFLDVENRPNVDKAGIIFPDAELKRFESTKECGKYEYSLEVITEDIA